MDTTTEVLVAGTLMVIGKWTEDADPKNPKKGHVSVQNVVGIVGAAVLLSLLSEADAKLAQGLGGILLISAVFTYAVPILKKVGLIK